MYQTAKIAGLDGIVHLTTRQYAAHRRAILANVRARLKEGRPCHVIATSLVEAGVDLDFPKVWRAEAGLEQIWQAAGRCNREGRWKLQDSVVTVFASPGNPPPNELKQLAGAMRRTESRHAELMSLDALCDYFGEVYWQKGAEGLDRIMMPDRDGRWVVTKVLGCFEADGAGTNFLYRSVAQNFGLIESGMVPVIVARDHHAKKALDRLRKDDKALAGTIARALQPYIVQVPPTARALLIACGHVRFEASARFGEQFAILSTDKLYSEETGLLWEDAEYLAIEGIV